MLDKYYNTNDEKLRCELINEMLLDYPKYLDLVLNNILEKKELRNNAYLLNIMSKKKRVNEYLINRFTKEHFLILVNDIDSKTRKNTYIFMGNLLDKNLVLDLVKCLKKEETNYCISSLILALGNYNIKNIKEILDKYSQILLDKLNKGKILLTHYNEIKNSIDKVLNKNMTINHTFNKLDRNLNIYLTCMKPLLNGSFTNIKTYFNDAKKIKSGVLVNSNNLDKIFKINCFYEALISLEGFDLDLKGVFTNIESFLNSKILENSCLGKGEFTYRINLVSEINKDNKLEFVNKVVNYINSKFNNYKNNPSLYEFEIRIIDNKDKTFDVFYKLCLYKDKRFDYRVKDLPASINPSSASMMLNELKPYLKENDTVLDPFCGTSTMLIERSKINKCDLTGVDISLKAIEYSLINSKKANINIRLVNKDILEFSGYYDEIISNMPYGNRVSNHKNNELLYKAFINNLPNMLNDSGVAILLTSELSLMKTLIKRNKKIKLIKDIYTETGGLMPHLFVIKKV